MTFPRRLQLRVSPEQHRRWVLVAGRRGMSLSAFLRGAGDEVADRVLDAETRLDRMVEQLSGVYPEAAESLKGLREEIG